ncbi:hypothetical protein ACFL35_03755 [Candidatus Riflebacteria bacterium]
MSPGFIFASIWPERQNAIWALLACIFQPVVAIIFPFPDELSLEVRRAFLTGELMLAPLFLLLYFDWYNVWSCGATAGVASIYATLHFAIEEGEQSGESGESEEK